MAYLCPQPRVSETSVKVLAALHSHLGTGDEFTSKFT